MYTRDGRYQIAFVSESDSWSRDTGVAYDPEDPARWGALASRRALVVGPTYWELKLIEQPDGRYVTGAVTSDLDSLMEVLGTRPLSEWESHFQEELYRLTCLSREGIREIIRQFMEGEPQNAEAKWAWLNRHLREEAQFESPYEGPVQAFQQWRDYVLNICERNSMAFLQQTMPKSAELLNYLQK